MIVALITIAVILILYGVVSRPLDARGITSAMIFTAAGLAVGTSALNLVNIHIESLAAERFCELALVFLLFSDSTRIDLAGLRRHLSWPSCPRVILSRPGTARTIRLPHCRSGRGDPAHLQAADRFGDRVVRRFSGHRHMLLIVAPRPALGTAAAWPALRQASWVPHACQKYLTAVPAQGGWCK
jgi:hypothetical protein